MVEGHHHVHAIYAEPSNCNRNNHPSPNTSAKQDVDARNDTTHRHAALSHRHQQHDHDHGHDHGSIIFEEHSALRSFLLLVALTFHSLFEGLAIGLQEKSGQLMTIFLAVIVHKAVMAFSLGLNLAQSAGVNVRKFIVANIIFSVSSPIGMGIGIVLSNLKQSLARDIANGTLQVTQLINSAPTYCN